MIEPLRSRLVVADLPMVRLRRPDGEMSGAPRTPEQAAGMALSVVYGWLQDLQEDLSWLPIDPFALEDHRDVVRRAINVLLDRLKEE